MKERKIIHKIETKDKYEHPIMGTIWIIFSIFAGCLYMNLVEGFQLVDDGIKNQVVGGLLIFCSIYLGYRARIYDKEKTEEVVHIIK